MTTETNWLEWLRAEHPRAMIARVTCVANGSAWRMEIACARPDVLIGKQATTLAAIERQLVEQLGGPVEIHLTELRRPQSEPLLVADHAVSILQRGAEPSYVLDVVVPMCRDAGVLGVRVSIERDGALYVREDGADPRATEGREAVRVTDDAITVRVWIAGSDAA